MDRQGYIKFEHMHRALGFLYWLLLAIGVSSSELGKAISDMVWVKIELWIGKGT